MNKNKGLELTRSQVKAFKNGANIFILPIVDIPIKKLAKDGTYKDIVVSKFPPVLKGDKDIFIKETFAIDEEWDRILYKTDGNGDIMIYTFNNRLNWQPASEMTKEQSRYSLKECIDIRVVRVKDISFGDWSKILGGINKNLIVPTVDIAKNFYINTLKEKNINRTYEDNDLIYLIGLKR